MTLRGSTKRLTRLTNAFSRSLPHLEATAVLYFAYYNLCRIHSTLQVTPAMEAEPTEHVWTWEEMLLATPEGLAMAA